MAPAPVVRSRARRAARGDWLQRAARFGLVVRGAMYILVGLLALQLALGERRKVTDKTGALGEIARKPLAGWLLFLTAAGFAALALWRLAQGALDTEHKGDDTSGVTKRAGYFARAAVYVGGCVAATSFLVGARGNDQTDETDVSVRVFELPLGRWLVGLAGIVIVGGCAWTAIRTLQGKFEENLKLEEVDRRVRDSVEAFAKVALTARLVVFSLLGVFLVRAAVRYNPREGVGLDQALRELLEAAAGPLLVGLVAIALMLFGVYSLFEARFREVLDS